MFKAGTTVNVLARPVPASLVGGTGTPSLHRY